MALEKISNVKGMGIPVMGDDIDTDRIIPARFMKCVTFDGLGEFAFFDAIKEAQTAGNVYPFGSEKYKNGSILISGANFGCGSSREHARPVPLQGRRACDHRTELCGDFLWQFHHARHALRYFAKGKIERAGRFGEQRTIHRN